MNWTRPPDLRTQLQKLWTNGALLACMVPAGPGIAAPAAKPVLFPLKLALTSPTSEQLVENFREVRSWSQDMQAQPHIRTKLREFRHRQLGINMVPQEVWIDSLDEALALLGHHKDAQDFALLCSHTQEHQPLLLDWLRLNSLRALALVGMWSRFLQIVHWLQQHPRPGIYLRQLGISGVSQGFLQTHRAVLCELLDLALPAVAVDTQAAAPDGFVQRYGFAEKPRRVRFRLLDPWSRLAIRPLDSACDVTLDVAAFAQLNTAPCRVFITTSESNFLAFPPLRNALVVHCEATSSTELFHSLGQTPWLRESVVHFWGDIDAPGFAMLDALRQQVGHAQSLLMDYATLLACETQWSQGAAQTLAAQSSMVLNFLTKPERTLQSALHSDRLRKSLRLSQDEIPWQQVLAALAALEA